MKRRWFILIPFMLALLAGIYLALTLPKKYGAETLILIQTQDVPNSYVRSVVSPDIDARISTISKQILSRTNLENIIKEFGLFNNPDQQKMFMEDKIAYLRKQITVSVTNDRRATNSFSIAYKGSDPEKVMNITTALTNYFINENIKVREDQAIGTNEFLESELASTGAQLAEMENKLEEYNRQHMGELPEQLETNLRLLDRLQEQLTSKQESLGDTKNRIQASEHLQADQRSLDQTTSALTPSAQGPSRLEALKSELTDLQSRYTGKHPDILRLEKTIADLEKEKASAPAGGAGSASTTSPAPAPAYTHLTRMERQQYIVDKNEIRTLQVEIADLVSQIAVLEKRIENSPRREQELLTIKRDYDNLNASYSSLLSRKLEAQLSVNIEKEKKGDQFRVIDPARYPTKPLHPDLPRLFLIVIVIGLGLGGGIVFLLEYQDSSFRKPEEIESFLGIPVVARITELYDPRKQKRGQINTVMSLASLLLSLGLLGLYTAITFFISSPESIAVIRKLTNL